MSRHFCLRPFRPLIGLGFWFLRTFGKLARSVVFFFFVSLPCLSSRVLLCLVSYVSCCVLPCVSVTSLVSWGYYLVCIVARLSHAPRTVYCVFVVSCVLRLMLCVVLAVSCIVFRLFSLPRVLSIVSCVPCLVCLVPSVYYGGP